MENQLTLRIPELDRLAAAIEGQTAAMLASTRVGAMPTPPQASPPVQPAANPTQAPAPVTAPSAPVAPPNGYTPPTAPPYAATSATSSYAPAYQPPAPPPAPTAPASGVPTAPAVYSLEQLMLCGQTLLDAGVNPTPVLLKFGVQALTQIQPEQYPQVAAEFRALGGAI